MALTCSDSLSILLLDNFCLRWKRNEAYTHSHHKNTQFYATKNSSHWRLRTHQQKYPRVTSTSHPALKHCSRMSHLGLMKTLPDLINIILTSPSRGSQQQVHIKRTGNRWTTLCIPLSSRANMVIHRHYQASFLPPKAKHTKHHDLENKQIPSRGCGSITPRREVGFKQGRLLLPPESASSFQAFFYITT